MSKIGQDVGRKVTKQQCIKGTHSLYMLPSLFQDLYEGGMQHSGEELVYNGQRECVRGGGQREGERDFQAILFNRIILPECTAETGGRQITYK